MDALETILTRRSVRRFSPDPVSDQTIHQLMEAAMSAPSAGNEQPWHFIIVKDRATLDQIADAHPYAGMCRQAAFAILTCCDPNLEKHKDYWPQDLSATTQNILLAARALDLGAVWCGVYPREERESAIKAICHIPDPIIPFSLVAIGYTDVKQTAVNRFKEARIHHNQW